MGVRDEKRAKFTPEARGGRRPRWPYLLAATVVVLLMSGGLLLGGRKSGSGDSYVDATGSTASGQPSTTDAVDVQSSIVGGNIIVPTKAIDDSGFVQFVYSAAGKEVPLLAYKTKGGQITAAVRMCEPCNSQSFHIEGDEIVCNACGTRWKTEDLSGVSGGCLTYPPAKLEATVQGGNLVIPESQVANWKARV